MSQEKIITMITDYHRIKIIDLIKEIDRLRGVIEKKDELIKEKNRIIEYCHKNYKPIIKKTFLERLIS